MNPVPTGAGDVRPCSLHAFFHCEPDGAFRKKELLPQPACQQVAAAGLHFFFFLAFLSALREGSRSQELRRAWWSPPPSRGLGSSLSPWIQSLGFILPGQVLALALAPHELCDLGHVPQH